ncbi:hypothetical protein V6N11_016766 [Hibiscus sabdariffa]|uniref:Cupin type-1 domain-containing protein n=1 Tax=Hibiscus sabdariffa TaxID=183260 RepID=A0ABR2TWI9_9ROSI
MTSGYGPGVAGIFLPEYEEKVIAIKKGDAIALPFGVITWWYNKDDTELVVLFMGDTSKSHKSGNMVLPFQPLTLAFRNVWYYVNVPVNFINKIFVTIELVEIKDSIVGIAGVNELSTEQRKKLTIAITHYPLRPLGQQSSQVLSTFRSAYL